MALPCKKLNARIYLFYNKKLHGGNAIQKNQRIKSVYYLNLKFLLSVYALLFFS
jgi:hypothetical protein